MMVKRRLKPGNRAAAKLKALAYHYAGQTVAAYVLGLKVLGVSLAPHDGHVGHLKLDPTSWVPWLAEDCLTRLCHVQAECQILVLLAGLPGERLFNPDAAADPKLLHEMEASSYIEDILGHPNVYKNRETHRALKVAQRAYLEYMRLRAARLVDEHRRAVRKLASTLLKERELDATQVKETLAGVLPDEAKLPRKLTVTVGAAELTS